jgi:threonine 3-dehydrogenase
MKAICKTRPAPGAELCEVEEPKLKAGHVLVRVLRTSVCGTDVHIYRWDPWAQSRLKPPLITGHEFCGIIEELGEDVEGLKVGDYVAGESHIICGHCLQCRLGQGHVCQNTRILGVDVNGCFAPYVVIPAANAQKTDRRIPPEVATVQDPLGNAVHTALSGPIAGATVLVTGCGPIGLFSIGVAKACAASKVIVTEVSPLRLQLAEAMGADVRLNPMQDDVLNVIQTETEERGVDVALEMSGHPSQLAIITRAIRPGGRISLLGIFSDTVQTDLNALIFKGVEIDCIVGRRLYQTWETMQHLLLSGQLDVRPAITHQFHYTEFNRAMELIQKGECGKVVFHVGD